MKIKSPLKEIKKLFKEYKNVNKLFLSSLPKDIIIEVRTLELLYMYPDDMVRFFDENGLYISVICDPDGLDWITELCAVPIKTSNSREEATIIGIEEAFEVLERQLKESKNYGINKIKRK